MFKSTLAAMAAVFALSALSPAAMTAKGDPARIVDNLSW